jgi:hypothetical protein
MQCGFHSLTWVQGAEEQGRKVKNEKALRLEGLNLALPLPRMTLAHRLTPVGSW